MARSPPVSGEAVEVVIIIAAGAEVTKEGCLNGALNVSRSIGHHCFKTNEELTPTEQAMIALPDVKHVRLEEGKDRFVVLASDGVWKCMSNVEVVEFVNGRLGTEELSKIAEALLDHCLAPNSKDTRKGCDNMNCIIIQFHSISAPLLNESNSGSSTALSSKIVSKKRIIDDTNSITTSANTEDLIVEAKRSKVSHDELASNGDLVAANGNGEHS